MNNEYNYSNKGQYSIKYTTRKRKQVNSCFLKKQGQMNKTQEQSHSTHYVKRGDYKKKRNRERN